MVIVVLSISTWMWRCLLQTGSYLVHRSLRGKQRLLAAKCGGPSVDPAMRSFTMLAPLLVCAITVLIFSSSAVSAESIDFHDDFRDDNMTDLVDSMRVDASDSIITVPLHDDEVYETSSSPVFDLLQNATYSSVELAAKKKKPSRCGKGNPMDDCWRCDPYWHIHRQNLAYCAIGFGRNAIGGLNGATYVVTDPGNDNPADPRRGTLRWAVVQDRPMWIIFARDMTIRLKQELIMTSYKTIDGRGVNVHIAYGACITLQRVNHVIIHGVHIHDCKATGPARVRSSMSHVGKRGKSDGDGISIAGSSNIWIDHNSLSRCADGLIDAIHGSNLITISNNYFSNQDKVMLFGASDSDGNEDKIMQITVAMNYFGPQLSQRMPRCRFGTFHVFNNFYSGWTQYAIGGSSHPTINSEGNYFRASRVKRVTKNLGKGNGNWRTSGDKFVNGAYFSRAGAIATSNLYGGAKSFSARPAFMVPSLTATAGPTGRT